MNNTGKNCLGTSLVVWASTTGGTGSILGWGTKTPQAIQHGLKKKPNCLERAYILMRYESPYFLVIFSLVSLR